MFLFAKRLLSKSYYLLFLWLVSEAGFSFSFHVFKKGPHTLYSHNFISNSKRVLWLRSGEKTIPSKYFQLLSSPVEAAFVFPKAAWSRKATGKYLHEKTNESLIAPSEHLQPHRGVTLMRRKKKKRTHFGFYDVIYVTLRLKEKIRNIFFHWFW